MTAIRPAATVVLLRDSDCGLEVLLLRRNAALEFAGGMWVFPGGRLDAEDYAGDPDDILAAARRAAVRETLEEAALVVAPEDLHYFIHWTTPEGETKRYATWFFVAALEGAQREVEVDGSEIEHHQWLRPLDALEAHRSHSIDLLPPTLIVLLELATCHSAAEAVAMYRNYPIQEIVPKFVQNENFTGVLYEGDAGYASGDPHLPGARYRCSLEADGWHYQRDLAKVF